MTTNETRPIRVLVVDDDPLVVSGLSMLINLQDDQQVVGSASDGDEVIDAINAHFPDVVLLDVRMKRRDGLAAATAVARLPKPPRVLMLTTWETDEIVRKAISVGAAGFLLKTAEPQEILDAIRNVHRGEGVLDPGKVGYVFDLVNQGDTDRGRCTAALARLSERERDVAIQVAHGLSNAEIGRQLHLGEATVKTHLANAQKKLGVTGRVGVAVIVTKAGLI